MFPCVWPAWAPNCVNLQFLANPDMISYCCWITLLYILESHSILTMIGLPTISPVIHSNPLGFPIISPLNHSNPLFVSCIYGYSNIIHSKIHYVDAYAKGVSSSCSSWETLSIQSDLPATQKTMAESPGGVPSAFGRCEMMKAYHLIGEVKYTYNIIFLIYIYIWIWIYMIYNVYVYGYYNTHYIIDSMGIQWDNGIQWIWINYNDPLSANYIWMPFEVNLQKTCYAVMSRIGNPWNRVEVLTTKFATWSWLEVSSLQQLDNLQTSFLWKRVGWHGDV